MSPRTPCTLRLCRITLSGESLQRSATAAGAEGLHTVGASWTQGLPFIAAGIDLIPGLASLLFCVYFRRYSAAWDLRLDETARSETILGRTLDQQ